MISYQALLLEIEQLVASTKNTTDEQTIREQLSAIRALCNVGLSNGKNYSSVQAQNSNYSSLGQAAQNSNSSSMGQTTQSSQSSPGQAQSSIIQNSNSLSGSKLQEDNANGDSIFDF
ncbi:MAG TPA: DUF5327 family protein [Ureibacillus sp.]|nr:DUF5327 family protein [Ureibacillus sp.]